jgi:glycerol-3-phosphate O-acyltransferase
VAVTRVVSLPLWAAAVIVVLAAWAALDRLLIPSVRWIVRRRVNRVLEELNTRLRIRIPPFKLTKRQVLIDRLLYDPEVQAALDAHARENDMPRSAAMDRVRRYAREIVPAFNAYLYFRLGYRAGRAVARSLFRVRLGYLDEAALATIPENATVVFWINHRSNMDYILVGYLAAERAALSYAVGEWARIWPLQTLIRSMGAYFVRRRSNDPLYRRVLERYVAMATAGGVTQAIFPEGGLTRDGALREPKLGLVDYMLKNFDPAGDRDIVFIPVGINYDRVFEDRSQLLLASTPENLPRPGEVLRKSLGFMARNVRLMLTNRWHRFGYACVNFGPPVSARAYLQERALDLRALPREARFAAVEAFARAMMRRLGDVIPAVPVALVASVLLSDPDRALSELELKGEIFALSRRLEEKGAHVYVPRGDQDYAIAVGLRMLTLRRVIAFAGGLYRVDRAEVPLLKYYANSIRHLLE